MTNAIRYQDDITIYQPKLLLDQTFSYEESVPLDDISRTVREAVEGANIIKYVNFAKRRSYGHDPVCMLEAVLMAFATKGCASLREMEELCRYDFRYRFLTNGETPSHMAFQRFIHDDLKMPIADILRDLNLWIAANDDVDTDMLYVDGSKWEANANKYTFVWKKSAIGYRNKLWAKTAKRIAALNARMEKEGIACRFSILKDASMGYLGEVAGTLDSLMDGMGIERASGKGHKKHWLQKEAEEFHEAAKKMARYVEYIGICGERGSFSKTDHDATFMHMKYDYYCHTNVFKPGYNVQLGVCSRYIWHIYVSPDANDVGTLMPFLEGYEDAYGELPKALAADAGYGSYDNYCFLEEKGIEAYVKYPLQRKKNGKIAKEDRFKKYAFPKDEEGRYVCPAGHPFEQIWTRADTRGTYAKVNETHATGRCEGCELRRQCTKSAEGRKITVCRKQEEYEERADALVYSEEGGKVMAQRSIQCEGVFGNLKEDNGYDRLRRRGESGVRQELYLVAIGHNLRRYHAAKVARMRKAALEAPDIRA